MRTAKLKTELIDVDLVRGKASFVGTKKKINTLFINY